MFNHAAQVFSRKPSPKTSPSRNTGHLRDISTTSTGSASSSSSTVSSASTLSSSTNIRHGPVASPTAPKPPNDSSSNPELNPLAQHPTFGSAPPPLSERPLIQPAYDIQPAPVRPAPPAIVTPKPIASRGEWRPHLADMLERKVSQFPHDYSPRHSIHTSTPVSNSASTSAQDYFVLKVPARPELKSHWSASTIQTPDMDCGTPVALHNEEDEEDDREGVYAEASRASRAPTPALTPSLTPSPPVSGIVESCSQRDSVSTVTQATQATQATEPTQQPPSPPRKAATAPVRNFSYKRCTLGASLSGPYGESLTPPSDSPRRPQMKTMDSIECWIKRGGWKRRGIVFQQAEGHAALAANGPSVGFSDVG